MVGTSLRMPLRRWVLRGLIAGVALTAAGCAQVPGLSFNDASTYKCLHYTLDGDVLAAATPVADLTGDEATMIAEATWDDGKPLTLENEADWYFAGHSDEGVLIMRTLPPDEVGISGPPGADHEIIEVSRLEGAPNAADGWYVTGASSCPLTIDLGGLEVPTVTLDPAHLPDAAAADISLLVTETACNSGQSADGRVRLVSLVETEESVTVTIGIKPRGGNATCPSNPATPFMVTLKEPLGDRTLIDGTRGVPLASP